MLVVEQVALVQAPAEDLQDLAHGQHVVVGDHAVRRGHPRTLVLIGQRVQELCPVDVTVEVDLAVGELAVAGGQDQEHSVVLHGALATDAGGLGCELGREHHGQDHALLVLEVAGDDGIGFASEDRLGKSHLLHGGRNALAPARGRLGLRGH